MRFKLWSVFWAYFELFHSNFLWTKSLNFYFILEDILATSLKYHLLTKKAHCQKSSSTFWLAFEKRPSLLKVHFGLQRRTRERPLGPFNQWKFKKGEWQFFEREKRRYWFRMRVLSNWANDHLSTMTTILRTQLELLLHIWPLNSDHLWITATIFGPQGWSLYTGLAAFQKEVF